MKNLKGFTLIELMIVMVIIGILLSLLLPGVFQGRQQAIKTQCQNRLRQDGIALYSYAKDNDGTLPTAASWFTELTAGSSPYLDTDTVTYCPKDGTTRYTAQYGTSNLYNLTSGSKLLDCSNHNIDLYADGHVK